MNDKKPPPTEAPKEQPKTMTSEDEVRGQLARMTTQFKVLLPEHITPEKFARTILIAIQKNPKLLTMNRQSLYQAALDAAQDGLLPDGKEGAIVPYKGKCKWTPMTRGLIKMARNTGQVKAIHLEVVYENDFFDYFINQHGKQLMHKPLIDGEERGNMKSTYVVLELVNGGIEIELMTRKQIEAVKKLSQAIDSPWKGDFEEEMWKKSVFRRLSKRLELSPQLERALERDNEFHDLPGLSSGSEQQRIPAGGEANRLKGMLRETGAAIDVLTLGAGETLPEGANVDGDGEWEEKPPGQEART